MEMKNFLIESRLYRSTDKAQEQFNFRVDPKIGKLQPTVDIVSQFIPLRQQRLDAYLINSLQLPTEINITSSLSETAKSTPLEPLREPFTPISRSNSIWLNMRNKEYHRESSEFAHLLFPDIRTDVLDNQYIRINSTQSTDLLDQHMASNSPTYSSIEIPIARARTLKNKLLEYQAELSDVTRNIEDLNAAKTSGAWMVNLDSLLGINRKIEKFEKEQERLNQRINILNEELYLQNRYDIELCTYAVLRQELAIASEGKFISNYDILTIAGNIYANIFNEGSVLLGLSPEYFAHKFATSLSIDQGIKRLDRILSSDFTEEFSSLCNDRLKQLRLIKQVIRDKGNQKKIHLNFSFKQVDVDLSQIFDDIPHFDIQTSDKQFLRITVIRTPQNLREEHDVLVLRENYSPDTIKKARMTISYYGRWESGYLKTTEHPDLLSTLRNEN